MQIAIVPGGGNIFRGMSVAAGGADRVTADMMGTLGTVIGDFTLDDDARARSGTGLQLRGQAYWRAPLSNAADLLVRASGSGEAMRRSSSCS